MMKLLPRLASARESHRRESQSPSSWVFFRFFVAVSGCLVSRERPTARAFGFLLSSFLSAVTVANLVLQEDT